MNPAGGDPARDAPDPEPMGVVLAGGQSRRMGQDKAQLEFAGKPLAAHAVSVLQEAGLSVMIAGAASPALRSLPVSAPVVEDLSPGLGPLSGVCAALSATSARHAVFLSVDSPLIPAALLVYLLRHARITGAAVTVSSLSGFAQTFPAVLDRSTLPALENQLSSRRYGCISAFHAASAALGRPFSSIAVELLAQSGQVSHPLGLPPAQWFLNLNTRDDLLRAEALRGRLRGRRIA